MHVAIESSDMKNLYDGIATLDATGSAVVELPTWFQALNKDFRYQLTCIGGFAPVYISSELKDNKFEIGGGEPGMRVSWTVTGIRQDAYAKAHPLEVEPYKPESMRGKYRHPVEHGATEEEAEYYENQVQLLEQRSAEPSAFPTPAETPRRE
jgi:hypothetical protein